MLQGGEVGKSYQLFWSICFCPDSEDVKDLSWKGDKHFAAVCFPAGDCGISQRSEVLLQQLSK